MLTQAPKGTKDILPSEVYRWRHVERLFDEICARYGFREIRTPVFEHTELFARGVGDTTDIVEKQMYTFDDYAGRSLTLRPEGTASVVRAFTENKLYAEPGPAKYRYEIDCFRYEKPQSGRLRAFRQFGVETFGTSDPVADAEIICLAADFLAAVGIRETELRINSIGCPVCRADYRDALRAFLSPKYDALCETCKGRFERNPLRILDCKSPVCGELTAGAPVMLDALCPDCEAAFAALNAHLDAFGVTRVTDPRIVRGLDYYTKTAFEFVSTRIGAQGTVCGGGRYDRLVEELGGPPTPGVGFGLGIERLLMVADAEGVAFPKPEETDVFVVCMGDDARRVGLGLLRRLRDAGLRAETDLSGCGVKAQFKCADRLGARRVVVIGEDELRENAVTIKDMTSGEQRRVPAGDAADALTGKDERK